MTPTPRRVVITGVGPISAVGIGREDFREGLAEGRDGRRSAADTDAALQRLDTVAECLDFVAEDYLLSEKTYLDRCSEFLLASCALALEDAGLDPAALDHPALGLSVGTAWGCLDSMREVTTRVQSKGLRFASPMIFTHSFANSPASLAAIEYAIQGPAATFCTGDTSSAAALQYALDMVRWGRAQVVLAGGVEALSTPLLTALDADESWQGVPGEGAAILVLEPAENARARGAAVLAELAGVGLAGGPPQDAARVALETARADAGLSAEQAPLWHSPPVWGHAFGAELALRVTAALPVLTGEDGPEALVVAMDGGAGPCADRNSRAAAAVIRRFP